MELNMPTAEQAHWGLRAMKTVAMADGTLDDAERQMLASVQTILGTKHPVEDLASVTPEELAAALTDRQAKAMVAIRRGAAMTVDLNNG